MIGSVLTFCSPSWLPNVTKSKTSDVVVEFNDFALFLIDLGFAIQAGSGNIFRMADTEVYAHTVGSELAFVMVTFAVRADALERLVEWESFAYTLYSKWGLSLVDKQKKVPITEFRHVLSQDSVWQVMSSLHHFPRNS